MPYTVYIIEDESVTRDLCAEYIRIALPEYQVIGTSDDGHTALDECLARRPDLIIIDIRLPDMSGLELLQRFKKQMPESKILIFSGTDCNEVVKSAWMGQADGFVEKRAGMVKIKEAVESIMMGRPFFSENVAAKIIDLSTTNRGPTHT